jgi:hypothetical protein
MKKFLLAFMMLAQAGIASASATGSGYLTQYLILNGVAFFWHNGTRSTPPACDTQGRFAFNVTTPVGQAALSGLLTAFASHKPVAITGTGACTDWSDSETMQYFSVTY